MGTPLDRLEVQATLDELIGSPNLFCAFRIDGHFERVETRTVPRQNLPYRPMLQAIRSDYLI